MLTVRRTGGIQFIMITLAFAQMLFFLFVSLKAYGGEGELAELRQFAQGAIPTVQKHHDWLEKNTPQPGTAMPEPKRLKMLLISVTASPLSSTTTVQTVLPAGSATTRLACAMAASMASTMATVVAGKGAK